MNHLFLQWSFSRRESDIQSSRPFTGFVVLWCNWATRLEAPLCSAEWWRLLVLYWGWTTVFVSYIGARCSPQHMSTLSTCIFNKLYLMNNKKSLLFSPFKGPISQDFVGQLELYRRIYGLSLYYDKSCGKKWQYVSFNFLFYKRLLICLEEDMHTFAMPGPRSQFTH